MKFVQLMMIQMMKLKKVGQPDFDRRFRITAPTDEAAQRAIIPPLRARLLAVPIPGLLGLRDGAALIELKPGPGEAGMKKVSADLRGLLAVLTATGVRRG